MVFIGSCSGFFYTLDKDTGKIKWLYDIKKDGDQTSFHGDMLFTDDLVIVGTDRGNRGTGFVYAFEKKTGKVRWKYHAGLGVGTAIIRKKEKIYFATIEDKVVCLDIKNGKENWMFSTSYSLKKYSANSPVLVSNTIFHGGLDGIVYALDAASGKLTWKRDLKKRVSAIDVSGNNLYVGTINGQVYKLNRGSGIIEKDFLVKGKIIRAITLLNNSIIFFTDWMKIGSEILALDLSLKGVLWRQKAPGGAAWYSAKPYVFKNCILVGTDKGDIFAFNIDDGVKMWTHHLEREDVENEHIRVFGSSNDVLYVGTLKGTLYVLQITE